MKLGAARGGGVATLAITGGGAAGFMVKRLRSAVIMVPILATAAFTTFSLSMGFGGDFIPSGFATRDWPTVSPARQAP